ncbi:hypothetical protein [Sedimenticola hydrogenitrophicus]|jgi:hypothetical protein|uniref:hypothetical protein n=1 Tax=Sedimenticola hydrogenitrophicus TaxID=2967975 RepID=UPI0021A41C70|nr:hypothetical protein [Sedimenticola hydrogenitrophicus]
MKRKKLLQKLADYLSLDQRSLRNKRAKMKQVLKQLREKERKLKKHLGHEQDPSRQQQLSRELDILRAQRHKGINVLRDLK